MSEKREEQLARLKEWVLDRRKGADEFGPSDDWSLDTAALEAALRAFEVMPELLEACRALLPFADECMPQIIDDHVCGPESQCDLSCAEASEIARVINKAMAAIAKAEGK